MRPTAKHESLQQSTQALLHHAGQIARLHLSSKDLIFSKGSVLHLSTKDKIFSNNQMSSRCLPLPYKRAKNS